MTKQGVENGRRRLFFSLKFWNDAFERLIQHLRIVIRAVFFGGFADALAPLFVRNLCFLRWHSATYSRIFMGSAKMNWLQTWATPFAILLAGALIAASVLFVDRWQISATGYGYATSGGPPNETERDAVYRLDRWTGKIQYCTIVQNLEVAC